MGIDENTDEVGRPGGRGPLTVEDGPLHDALVAIDQALADIEDAKATLAVRRDDFARVLQSEVGARADDPDALAQQLCDVVRTLYWDHPTLRVADLSAATGLSNERVRRVAGPRLVEVACTGCGTPTEVLQTRRTERVPARCADCRGPAPRPLGSSPWPWVGLSSSLASTPSATTLRSSECARPMVDWTMMRSERVSRIDLMKLWSILISLAGTFLR